MKEKNRFGDSGLQKFVSGAGMEITMNIMYTCDDNYVWLMGISAVSLFEMNKDCDEINVYLLGNNISSENKDKLSQISKQYKRNIEVIEVPDLNIPESMCDKRWPKSAYTRLYAGELLPKEVDKVIYLDCDTIVNGSLLKLWKVDMGEKIVFGVLDCISDEYKKNIGLGKTEPYLNAGVLMFQVKLMRETDINQRINSFFDKYKDVMVYADQDLMNGIFAQRKGCIDIKYNVMSLFASYSYEEIMKLRRPRHYYSKKKIENAKENPSIIHYTTCMLNVRPWFKNSEHPYGSIFLKYMEISPWNQKELSEAGFNSRKDKMLKILERIPKIIAYNLIGFVHAYMKPFGYRMKNRLKRK